MPCSSSPRRRLRGISASTILKPDKYPGPQNTGCDTALDQNICWIQLGVSSVASGEVQQPLIDVSKDGDVTISAIVPRQYADALDQWIAGQSNIRISRAEAIRRMLARMLDLPPTREYCSSLQRKQSERDRSLIALYQQLGTFAAVGQTVGLSATRVANIIYRERRRARR